LKKSTTFAFRMETAEYNDIIQNELLDEEDGSVVMAADNPWRGMADELNELHLVDAVGQRIAVKTHQQAEDNLRIAVAAFL